LVLLLKLLPFGLEQQYFFQPTRKLVAFFTFFEDIMHFVMFRCYNIYMFGFGTIVFSSNCKWNLIVERMG